jgi:hypothetical protein
LAVGLWCVPLNAAAEQAVPPIAQFSQLQLFSNFWLNLHHFLYVSAWSQRPVNPQQRRLAMALPPGSDVAMEEDERKAWDTAVSYEDRA